MVVVVVVKVLVMIVITVVALPIVITIIISNIMHCSLTVAPFRSLVNVEITTVR